MWDLPSAKLPRIPRSGTLRMICKPQKLGPLYLKVKYVIIHQETILVLHFPNMLICHITTIHELQKQAVWQLFQAFLSGGSEYPPNSYCPSPLPGTLATMPRKHPITDGNRITVAGQAD